MILTNPLAISTSFIYNSYCEFMSAGCIAAASGLAKILRIVG